MVNIPPIKMVMTGGWFIIVLATLLITPWVVSLGHRDLTKSCLSHSFRFPRLWTQHQEVMPKSCLSVFPHCERKRQNNPFQIRTFHFHPFFSSLCSRQQQAAAAAAAGSRQQAAGAAAAAAGSSSSSRAAAAAAGRTQQQQAAAGSSKQQQAAAGRTQQQQAERSNSRQNAATAGRTQQQQAERSNSRQNPAGRTQQAEPSRQNPAGRTQQAEPSRQNPAAARRTEHKRQNRAQAAESRQSPAGTDSNRRGQNHTEPKYDKFQWARLSRNYWQWHHHKDCNQYHTGLYK